MRFQKLDFEASDLHVWVEDAAGSGVFVEAGLVDQLGDSANGRFRRRAKDGQSLPLGVWGVAELAGRLLEVRDDLDAVVLSVVVPAVE